MRNRLFSVIAAGAIVVAACSPSGQSSQSPSSSSGGTESQAASAPAESQSASGGPSSSASAGGAIDLTTTKYKAEPVGNKGGNLVIGISGDPSSFWFNTYDTFANDVEAFGPSLLSLWNNTADLKYYGQLTTDVPLQSNGGVTVNGTTMDVKVDLIPGAQWSDGTPITCDDVIYMQKWIMDKGQTGLASGTSGYEDISSIDGAGTTNCVLHFKKIYEPYIGLFSPLYPAKYLQKSSAADAQKNLYVDSKLSDGVYSGPYMPTVWQHDAQINYVPNQKFWDTIKKQPAPFDAVTMKFYADTDAEIAGFANGEVDVALEFNQNQLAAMGSIDPGSIDKTVGPTYEHNQWNMKNLTAKFGDAGAKAMMEALHYAYDKDAINQTITGGTVTPTCNGIFPGTWFYNANLQCYKHDPDKAASILQAAGFTKGSDGILTLNGNKAEFLACARQDRQYRLDTLNLVASQLQPLGIKLTVKGVKPSAVFAGWTATAADTPCNTTHGNFDAVEFAWLATPDPGSNAFLYQSKYNPDLGDHSGQNYPRVNIPSVDQDFDKILSSVNLQDIQTAMNDFQKTYTDPAQAFPEIPLYNWTTVLLKSPKMHNIANNASASAQAWNIEDWWRGQ